MNVSIYSGFYKSIKDFIQPFLKTLVIGLPIFIFWDEHKKTAFIVGITYFLIFLSNSYASRNASKFAKLVGSPAKMLNFSLFFGAILGIVTGILMKFSVSFYAVPIFLVLLFLENARKPSGVSFITEHSNPDVHTGVLSVTSQFSSVAASLFVLLVGIISDRYGVGIGIAVISALILVLYPFVKVKSDL